VSGFRYQQIDGVKATNGRRAGLRTRLGRCPASQQKASPRQAETDPAKDMIWDPNLKKSPRLPLEKGELRVDSLFKVFFIGQIGRFSDQRRS